MAITAGARRLEWSSRPSWQLTATGRDERWKFAASATPIVRSLLLYLLLIAAEILHGIARAVFLVPYVGDFRSNQIGVFTGSLIILAIALVFVRWIGASRSSPLLGIGVLWAVMTVAFEILFGRFVAGYPGSGCFRTTTSWKAGSCHLGWLSWCCHRGSPGRCGAWRDGLRTCASAGTEGRQA